MQVVKNATASNANDKITESLSYDANGNLELITDGNGNKTKYVYDAMNRRTSAIYGFESATTRTDNFEYDALNMTNRKGVPLTYDARNRLATEGGSSRTYTYDLCGRILSVNGSPSPNANVLYVYDALGRLISEKNGSRTHFYEYDLANRRIKSFYGSESSIFENSSISHSLATQYNTNGKIEKLTDQQGRTTIYAYDPNGNVVKKTNPNGYILTNSYDALNRVRSKNCEDVKYDYYYDLGGNVIRFYEWNKRGVNIMSSWDSILVYDAFDRLVSETLYDTNTIYITTYTYDSNGNRLTKRLQKGLESEGENNQFEENYAYAVNSLNQVVGVTKRRWVLSNPEVVETTTSAITYNARGNANLISSSDGKSTEFNYDEFDMIVSARDYDFGNTISSSINMYDYRGRRVEHGCQSSSFDYEKVYSYSDGTSVLESRLDLNDRSERKTLFYRGSDQGGGVGGINYSEFADGTDLNYKFYNLRGDVVLTIDGNSNVSSKYLYFGFGKNVLERGSEIAADKHRANTKVEDESSLLNEGKRFRHLELDIFLTPDPLEYIDGYNPYIYVNQNPWGRWDPEGLFWDTIWDIGNIIYDAGAAIYNHIVGDHETAKSHWKDAGYDTAAAFIPGVPAGVTKLKKASELANKFTKATKGTKKVANNLKNAERASDNVRSSKELAEEVTIKSKNTASDVNPMQRGRDSEKRVLEDLGMEKNTEKFSTSQGNVIPDAHPNPGRVIEIKDAKNVSNTRQIRGEKELANREGGKLEIHTGYETNVSKNAQDNATIVRHKNLGPKNNE